MVKRAAGRVVTAWKGTAAGEPIAEQAIEVCATDVGAGVYVCSTRTVSPHLLRPHVGGCGAAPRPTTHNVHTHAPHVCVHVHVLATRRCSCDRRARLQPPKPSSAYILLAVHCVVLATAAAWWSTQMAPLECPCRCVRDDTCGREHKGGPYVC